MKQKGKVQDCLFREEKDKTAIQEKYQFFQRDFSQRDFQRGSVH